MLIESLAQEASALRRRQLLLASRSAWDGRLVGRLYDETVRRMYVDIPQAERMARSAVWLSAQLGDELAVAAGLRARAHVLERKRRYWDALEQFQQALEIYERLGMEIEVARTLNFSLQCMMYLGRYDDALAWAARAADIFARYGDQARLARLDGNIGNLLHRQDRFDEAMERYRRAYASFLEVGEPRDVATALQNMATCQISMNDFRQAMDTYERTRRYCLGTRIAAPGRRSGLQHRLPLLPSRRIYQGDRNVPGCARALPGARRLVP